MVTSNTVTSGVMIDIDSRTSFKAIVAMLAFGDHTTDDDAATDHQTSQQDQSSLANKNTAKRLRSYKSRISELRI